MSGMICPMTPMNGNSFTDYQEPTYWESMYKPYQTEWFKQIQPKKVVKPLSYSKKHQDDEPEYKKLRAKVVEESLQIDRINCPIYNIHDQSIDYSGTGKLIREQQANKEKVENTLFSVREDEPVEVENNG